MAERNLDLEDVTGRFVQAGCERMPELVGVQTFDPCLFSELHNLFINPHREDRLLGVRGWKYPFRTWASRFPPIQNRDYLWRQGNGVLASALLNHGSLVALNDCPLE